MTCSRLVTPRHTWCVIALLGHCNGRSLLWLGEAAQPPSMVAVVGPAGAILQCSHTLTAHLPCPGQPVPLAELARCARK
ncbi:hypothetical protein V8C86DRAFT_897627 [Haematococcus lacustris]